jgi:CHRD domain-containing protein
MRRLGVACVMVSIVLAVVALALPAGAGGRPLTAHMTGAQEVPGPGDPDASGTATFTVNPGRGEICFDVTSEGLTLPVVAAHIHPGAAGVAGPPLVFLLPAGATDADGQFSDCVTFDRATVRDIAVRPWAYYVNLHTGDFQAGAIRGQLG